MSQPRRLAGLALVILTSAAAASALLIEEPGDTLPQGKEWPIHLPLRVKGYWLNGNNFYYYRGNTTACNAFLQDHAGKSDTPLVLYLHPGPGKTGMAGAMDRKIPYDWELGVIRRWSGFEIAAVLKRSRSREVSVVHIYLGGSVDLEDLDVPLTAEVRSGGEIERFVAHHETKQGLERGPAAPDADDKNRPTPKGTPEAKGAGGGNGPNPPASAEQQNWW